MKLRNKILLPVVLVLVLTISVIVFSSYQTMNQTIHEIVEDEMQTTINNLKNQMALSNAITDFVMEKMDEKNLALSRALAEIISTSPDMLTFKEMDRLAKLLDVDEVHVTDGKGVLLWGNIEGFYGFDFSTNPQTKPFLEVLSDPTFELAQEPELRGTTGDLFQYTGVARKDTKGIVQVGISANAVGEMEDMTSVQNTVEQTQVGKKGFAFIIKDGKIVAHDEESSMGKDVSNENWYSAISSSEKGSDWITIDNVEYFTKFESFNNSIITVVYPRSEFYGYLNTVRNINVVLGVAGTLLMTVVIWFVIRRNILRPVKLISKDLSEIAEGNLSITSSIHSKDEMGQLSNDLGKVVHTLAGLTDDLNTLYSKQLIEGDVDYFIDETKYKGGYLKVTAGINTLVHGLIGDISMLMDVMKEFDRGYFQGEIPTMPGKKVAINENVTAISTKIQTIIEKANELVDAAINGELTKRVDASVYEGDWGRLLKRFNRLFEAVSSPIEQTSDALEEMAKGQLSVKITGEVAGDYGKIKTLFNSTQDTIRSYISEISSILGEMAHENLAVSIDRQYIGDFAEIQNSIEAMIEVFNKLLEEVGKSSDEIAASATGLNQSAESLSYGANEQTTSIMELSEITNDVEKLTLRNAEAATKTNEFLRETRNNAQKSTVEMNRLLLAIEEINKASQNISQIIKVIDDIALQTDLLALNAAVEASRAGVHGKGFAVVAEHVRVLAGRSQAAAKETEALIATSTARANDGTMVANETAAILNQIVEQIEKSSDSVADIAKDSQEQTVLIHNITTNVDSISSVTTANSSAAEETAAAAQQLSAYVEMFRNIVARFKLKH